MSKKRMIALDADYITFMCTESSAEKGSMFGSENGSVGGSVYKESLKPYKTKFKKLVNDVENEIAAHMPGEVKGIRVILSDSRNNFRYDFYPEYKGERPKRSKLFYRLRKWAEKEYGYKDNIEADDEVAYLVREKNWIGASMDKDLYRGVPGNWFNTHYMNRTFIDTSILEARNFNLIQCLMGDPTDNIPALPKKPGDGLIYGTPTPGKRKPFKVTEKIAIELLDEYGWNWDGVVAAFALKEVKVKYAIRNKRLVSMDQARPSKKGGKKWKIKLFTP